MKRLLLISNSRAFGQGYLDHVAKQIIDFLKDVKTVLFIPYALHDRNNYTTIVKERFNQLGIEVSSIHKESDPIKAVEKTQALFIGGGNTFRLLNAMYKENILNPIRQKVKKGIPYIGTSAGANVACPTIKTTNDMPIIYPPTFDALNLVPFQINPHYVDPDPNSKFMGETRDQRLKEFHEENNQTVVGLREGSWLKIEGKDVYLEGETGAKIFINREKPQNYKSGNKLNFLL